MPRVEALIAERLVARLSGIWEHRLGLVVAPPGSGKSTLLAAFAGQAEAAVAWYRADRFDVSREALLARLADAFAPLSGSLAAWPDADAMIADVDAIAAPRILLAVDDLHALEGSQAEQVLDYVIDRGPSRLHVLAASRSQPRLDQARRRLAGELLEVTADDLRFRAWEVERLFRDFYEEPMAPEELARLARWTEGWAAGLQLFHLATRGRPADERRRVLRSLGPRSRLAREYLAQNVLDRVGEELRHFLVETSVLGRLSGPLCDRLLERTGSDVLLEELERRCLFTTRIDDDGVYRYHEVFRSHLQGVLVGEVGEGAARSRFLRAAGLLEEIGAVAEALEAYVRAEAWELVERMLAAQGPSIAEEPLRWLNVEAQRSLREDAWLGLAGARRLRAEGRFRDAADAYGVVARETLTKSAADSARRERAAILAWLEPDTIRPPDPTGAWWALLRDVLQRDPRTVVAREVVDASDPGTRLIGGLALLAAGDLRQARAELADLAERPDAEGLIACIAQVARGAAALLGGDEHGIVDLNGAIGAAEGLGSEWIARVARSMLALSGRPHHLREAGRLGEAADALDDRWGATLARLSGVWGRLVAGSSTAAPPSTGEAPGDDDADMASAMVAELRALGVPVLQAWAAAILAIGSAAGGSAGAAGHVESAGRLARAVGVEALDLLCQLALAIRAGEAAARDRLSDRLERDHGIRPPLPRIPDRPAPGQRREGPALAAAGTTHAARVGAGTAVLAAPGSAVPPGPSPAPGPPAELRLFGGFQLRIGGDGIDLASLRPRVRSLLHVLALGAGRPLHRERISEILWPGADPTAAARNLHVAVASLRRVLEPQASRGGFRFVLREGESYVLSLPPGSQVDVIGFEQAVAEARRAQAAADRVGVERWTRAALERYAGELLPEEGPAEWVVTRRDALRSQAVEAATMLATLLLERGQSAASAAVCADALELDRYHDPLWRTLIAAREASGDPAAARTARSGYRRALEELGVDVPPGSAT